MSKVSFYIILAFACLYNSVFAASSTPEDTRLMCGPNCLWLAVRSLDIQVSLKKLRYFAETDSRGTSLKNMLKALEKVGLYPLLLKTDWKGLTKIKNPTILLLDGNTSGHYVFLHSMGSEKIILIDPPEKKTYTKKEFMSKFNSYAIVAYKNLRDKKQVEKQFGVATSLYFAKKLVFLLMVIFLSTITLFILKRWDTLSRVRKIQD